MNQLNLNKEDENPLEEMADALNEMATNMDLQTDLLAKIAKKSGSITDIEYQKYMKKDGKG